MKLRVLSFVSCAAVLLAAAPFVNAQITGTVYENTPDPGDAGSTSNMSSSLAHAGFTVGSAGIDFQTQTGGTTVAGFLNNPTFTNPMHGFSGSDNVNNPNGDGTEVVLTGMTYLNAGSNSFEVAHDDGVVLTLGGGIGNVVDQPGPTSETTTPFNVINPGAAGEFSFTLDYSECCGAPADLIFAVNNAPVGTTPEPSSFILFGSGLLAAAGIVRRRLSI